MEGFFLLWTFGDFKQLFVCLFFRDFSNDSGFCDETMGIPPTNWDANMAIADFTNDTSGFNRRTKLELNNILRIFLSGIPRGVSAYFQVAKTRWQLGISTVVHTPSILQAELAKAYRTLALRYHPATRRGLADGIYGWLLRMVLMNHDIVRFRIMVKGW